MDGSMDRRGTLRALGAAAVSLPGLGGLAGLAGLAGCAAPGGGGAGWTTLIDGATGLENFERIGDANWRGEDGAIVADRGQVGFLVTRSSWADFALRAEFWARADTNSGIFVRLSDPRNITADNSYEVNIWDTRPDPRFGTGAIVNVVPVPVPLVHRADGRWSVMEVEARGPELSVRMNGVLTAMARDARFPRGPIALQYAPAANGAQGGPIRWRSVRIRAL